jgi:thiamine pyrophosphate-dependent acetolactate synthase large subunit-like protein
MMQRNDLLEVIQNTVTDEVVVPVMSAIKGWAQIPEHFFWCTAMGYGSSVALGLALAQPERKVILLDGDGSLLMNLGSLVTIAGQSPPNLVHIVLENGLYELPGSVPLPGRGRFSLTGVARAAGLEKIREFRELEDFEKGLTEMLRNDGPFFATAQVAPGSGEGLPKMTLVDMSRKLERALSPS